jgi:hypothetical protein
MQSDAVSTSSTKGRREPEEPVAQDKHPLPKSFRQTADKMETLIRNTSRLSTTDDPKGTFFFDTDEKEKGPNDTLQQLLAITKTVGTKILEKKDTWSQQEWSQLCENIATQLKYIEMIEQSKK